jgi:hypothetical protein
LGFDDWALKYPDDTPAELLGRLRMLPRIPVHEFEAAKSWSIITEERFNRSYVDLTDRGDATLLLQMTGTKNARYLTDLRTWAKWEATASRWRLDKEPLEWANALSRHYILRAQTLTELVPKISDKVKAEAAKATAVGQGSTPTLSRRCVRSRPYGRRHQRGGLFNHPPSSTTTRSYWGRQRRGGI